MSKRPITVAALRRILATEDPEKLVVLEHRPARKRGAPVPQPEFHAVHSVSGTLSFDPKSREVGLDELTPAAVRLGYTEDQVLLKGKPAVILSP